MNDATVLVRDFELEESASHAPCVWRHEEDVAVGEYQEPRAAVTQFRHLRGGRGGKWINGV